MILYLLALQSGSRWSNLWIIYSLVDFINHASIAFFCTRNLEPVYYGVLQLSWVGVALQTIFTDLTNKLALRSLSSA